MRLFKVHLLSCKNSRKIQPKVGQFEKYQEYANDTHLRSAGWLCCTWFDMVRARYAEHYNNKKKKN